MGASFVLCFCSLLPSLQAQEFQSLRAAITQLRNPGTAAKFSDNDLQHLWAVGLKTWSTCETHQRQTCWLLAC